MKICRSRASWRGVTVIGDRHAQRSAGSRNRGSGENPRALGGAFTGSLMKQRRSPARLIGLLHCRCRSNRRASCPPHFKYARLDSNQRARFWRRNPSGPRSAIRSISNTPGWTRTSDPGIRNLRRDDFAIPEETTKSTVSLCSSTTSESTSDFARTASFTAQMAEKAADLRIPQIEIGLQKSIRPDLIRGRGSRPDGLPLPERESPQERNLMTPIPRRFSEPDRAHRFLLRRTAP